MTYFWTTLPLRVVNTLNRREHWAVRAKRNAAHRQAVTLRLRTSRSPPPPLPLVVTLVRIAPRPFDDDGTVASLKAVRDAVAAFYCVDDGPGETRLVWRYGYRQGAYAVEVRLEPRP